MNFGKLLSFLSIPFLSSCLKNVSYTTINKFKSYLKRKPVSRYVYHLYDVFNDIGPRPVQNNIISQYALDFFFNLSLGYRASSQNTVFKILYNLLVKRELYEIETLFIGNL